jgi:hypothetical protein
LHFDSPFIGDEAIGKWPNQFIFGKEIYRAAAFCRKLDCNHLKKTYNQWLTSLNLMKILSDENKVFDIWAFTAQFITNGLNLFSNLRICLFFAASL